MTGVVIVAVVVTALLFFALVPPIWREWRERTSPVGRLLRRKPDPMMQPFGDVPYRGFR